MVAAPLYGSEGTSDGNWQPLIWAQGGWLVLVGLAAPVYAVLREGAAGDRRGSLSSIAHPSR